MAQAQSVQIPKRFPLVIEPENRGDTTNYDAKLVNAYVERGKDGETYIYERPGTDEHSRPPAGNATGLGCFTWRGSLYSIFGDTLYKDGVAVSGTVNTAGGIYRFDSCLGATPKLQLGNGVKAYNYDTSGGLVEITDADFPTSFVKGWAYLNGTSYVATPSANIQGSDINDPVNWNALNTILAQIEPDQGVALFKQLVYVVILKQWSGEVFYDAGNAAGSPLGRVEGAKMNWGCLANLGAQDLGGTLVWPGSSQNGGPEVLMLDNLKIGVISNPPVERLLAQADFSAVYSFNIKIEGHRFYVLTLKNDNLTLVYDLDEKMWAQWIDTNGNYIPWVSATVIDDTTHVVQHETNGRLYTISSDYATDDGDLIQVDIVTPNTDLGVTARGKMLNMLYMVTDQRAGSILQVRNNDQDYNPKAWTNWRQMDLSIPVPYIDKCGTFARRAYHFRHRAPVRMPRIKAMEMQVDLCTLQFQG